MDKNKDIKEYACKTFSGTPIISFNDPRLTWHNGTPNFEIINDTSIKIHPTAKLDYWSKTFYGPKPLIVNNGQTLVAKVPYDEEATITTSFTLHPTEQFDQAGIMIIVNENIWVKAGIEYTDGWPNLSCVVTNQGYSDWSTQRIVPTTTTNKNNNNNNETNDVSLHIRVSKVRPGAIQGPSLIFEAAYFNEENQQKKEEELDWFQVRIASLRSPVAQQEENDSDWLMGIFSNAPTKQNGSYVTFHNIEIGEKVKPIHDANL